MLTHSFSLYAFCPWGGAGGGEGGEARATRESHQKGGDSHQPEEATQHTNTATPQGRGEGGRGDNTVSCATTTKFSPLITTMPTTRHHLSLIVSLTPHEGKGLLFMYSGISALHRGGFAGMRRFLEKKTAEIALRGEGEAISARESVMEGKERNQERGEGLPCQAYAICDSTQPALCKLPHHTREISRAVRGKVGMERTVDWSLVEVAVQAISRAGYQGQRVQATENQIIDAARHLARHYHKAGKPLPDALAILI